MGGNIKITKTELDTIRTLGDFDLTMLLSEVHDHGWPQSRKLIPMILEAVEHRKVLAAEAHTKSTRSLN